MQVCTSLQTDNHANTSPLRFFTGRMPFLPPNQQRQSTEGTMRYVMRYGYIDENNVLLYGRHFYNAADEFLFVRLRRLLQQTYVYISH